jgi:phosphonate transport system permease protein
LHPRTVTAALVGAAAAASLAWVLLDAGLFDASLYSRWWDNFLLRLGDMVPPDTDAALLAGLVGAIGESLRIAWAGTLLGLAAALPLAVMAAAPLSPPWLAMPVRALLSAIRTVPAILWALLLVAIVGLGAPSGILALTIYTTGFLGKLLYESFEGVDPELLDAMRATGASRLAVARQGVLPEMGNAILSNGLYAFEYNVRASSILGLVGAGGIGTHILLYVGRYQFERVATAIILMFAVVLLVEAASRLLRKRFLAARAAPA